MTTTEPAPFPADRLKPHRQLLGYSRTRLAAALGVDDATIRAWERGYWNPNAANLARLIDVLGPLDTWKEGK